MEESLAPGTGHSNPAYTVRGADWARDRERLRQVREPVFVHEQRVPLEMEWDEDDETALHALAEDADGRPVGTGRLTGDGRIGRVGRMAVLKEWRGRGVASAILEWLTEAARERGFEEIVLNAQVSAISFYRRFGYTEEGEEFQDAGIPHRRMRRRLSDD